MPLRRAGGAAEAGAAVRAAVAACGEEPPHAVSASRATANSARRMALNLTLGIGRRVGDPVPCRETWHTPAHQTCFGQPCSGRSRSAVIAAALWYFLRDPLPYPADWIVVDPRRDPAAPGVRGARDGHSPRRRSRGCCSRPESRPPTASASRSSGPSTVTGEPLQCADLGDAVRRLHLRDLPLRARAAARTTRPIAAQGDRISPASRSRRLCCTRCRESSRSSRIRSSAALPSRGGATKRTRSRRASAYIQATTFDKTTPFIGELTALDHAMKDSSGSIRKDWRMSDGDDLRGSHLQEQCIPPVPRPAPSASGPTPGAR